MCLAAKEPGKFDLVYQSADGAETIEYAVSQDKKVLYQFILAVLLGYLRKMLLKHFIQVWFHATRSAAPVAEHTCFSVCKFAVHREGGWLGMGRYYGPSILCSAALHSLCVC